MRLIDADKLMGELHESLKGDCDLRKDYEFMGIDEFIENQPTAYDVDKVMVQLKNSTYNMEICEEIPSKRKDMASFVDKEYKMIKLDDAIEIVKGKANV